MFYHTSVIVLLDAEVYPEMSRNRGKDVPEGNGPVPHYDKFGSEQPTMAGLFRMLKTRFDRSDKNVDRMLSHFDQ